MRAFADQQQALQWAGAEDATRRTLFMSFPNDQIAWMTSNRDKVFQVLRYVQVGLGLVLLALGWHMGNTNVHLLCEGTRTQGQLVGYYQEQFPRSGNATSRSTVYMPVVEYRVGDRTVQFHDWLGSPSAGATHVAVTVLYDPGNPGMVIVDRPVWNWLPWLPIMAVGLLLIPVGFVGLRRSPT